jgi:phage terminase small subunit
MKNSKKTIKNNKKIIKKLTKKAMLFADLYIKFNGNSIEAYKQAYKTFHRADVEIQKLLNDERIQNIIKNYTKETETEKSVKRIEAIRDKLLHKDKQDLDLLNCSNFSIDYKNVLKCEEMLAKLKGIYKEAETNINNNIEFKGSFNFE